MNFMQWRKEQQIFVPIQSWKSDAELRGLLGPLLAESSFRRDTCYDNSMKICRAIPGCRYILGRVTGDGQSVDHAWNEWNGIHFDVTRELYSPESLQEFHWQAFSALERSELDQLAEFNLAPSIFEVFDRVCRDQGFAANPVRVA